MASDAFFPFPDCVELASEAGITAVLQPGGSIKDQDSIDKSVPHVIKLMQKTSLINKDNKTVFILHQ